jgi:hypothetical protein
MVAAAEARSRQRRPGLGISALAALGGVFLAVTAFLSISEGVRLFGEGRPDSATAPSLETLQKLSALELREVEAKARAAFGRTPLDADALLTLARTADLQGDKETSARLKLIAGDLQPRVTSTQVEALSILLARRDFASALKRIDGLIRARPNRRTAFLTLVMEVAADPEGRNAVASVLAGDPPWRAELFKKILSDGKPEIALGLVTELRAQGSPAANAELALLVDHYLKAGDTAKAHTIWLSSLNKAELDRVKLIYDGGFEGDIRNLLFDWTVQPESGFTHRTFPRNTSSMDMSLNLEFQGFGGAFHHLSQIILLRPGRYRLTGESRFEAFQSPGGLVFRFYCLSSAGRNLIAETAVLPQSSQWTAFEKPFDIPAEDCTSQILRLESRELDKNLGEIQGKIALDNLAIAYLPGLVE